MATLNLVRAAAVVTLMAGCTPYHAMTPAERAAYNAEATAWMPAASAIGQQLNAITAQQQAEQLYQQHRFEWRQDIQNLQPPPQPMQRYCPMGC